MRKLILPSILAAAFAFLPAQAHASWLSEALHQARGDYNYGPGYYGYQPYGNTPSYGYSGYSGYDGPGYDSTPNYSYDAPQYYSPPVYNYTPRYDSTPSYQYAPYSGYSTYYPQYRYGGRDWDRHERREHEEREEHGQHERYEHHR